MQDSLLKQCTKCGELKSVDCFNKNSKSKDGLRSWCRFCDKIQREENKAYYENYRKIHKQQEKDYNNSEETKLRLKQYAQYNKAKLRSYYQEYYKNNKERIYKYQQDNLDHINIVRRQNYKTNINRKLSTSISVMFRRSLKENKANQHWEDLISYNLQQLKQHLESQFTPEMNWDNYGTYWEIDHIIPQSLFDLSDVHNRDFKICWSLLNLRPLTVSENRSRPKDGSDIPETIRQQILGQNL